MNQDYVDNVLSYAPVPQWKRILDLPSPVSTLDGILQVDCLASFVSLTEATTRLESLEQRTNLSDGERMYLSAYRHWLVDGDLRSAYAKFEAISKADPLDLFACKRGQLMALLGGFNASILTIARLVEQPNQGRPFFAGMLAFGYEQAGEYQLAESTARGGMSSTDGWVQHALAHALFFQGPNRVDEAIAFLESHSQSWSLDAMMPFLYSHLWWHLALLYTKKRRFQDALDLFDRVLWPTEEAKRTYREDVQVQINALELLWILQSQVTTSDGPHRDQVTTRWEAVLDTSKTHVGGFDKHHDCLFHTLILGALTFGGAELADRQRHLACLPDGKFKDLLENLVRTLDDGDSRHVDTCKDEWSSIGGSTEQRAVLLEAVLGICG